MAHVSKTTTDHNEIRKWVEKHGGHPAVVKRTEGGGDVGLLRIDFPGYSGEGSLEPISWEDFFKQFEESKLAFLYEEKTAEGKDSRFCKLIRRGDEHGHTRSDEHGHASGAQQSHGRSEQHSQGRGGRS